MVGGWRERRERAATLYISFVKRSRLFLSASAFAALAAWGNTQAMACCWLPEAIASVSASVSAAVVEAASVPEAVHSSVNDSSVNEMAADHSCCHGSKSAESESSSTSSPEPSDEGGAMPAGCGIGAHSFVQPCCESGTVAAIPAASDLSFAPGITGLYALPYAAMIAPISPRIFVLAPPHGGSPPYMTFRRLLI